MCGCKEHYWKADKERHECKKCGYGQSLKSNTVMQGFRLPFCYWFMSTQMLTSTKKGISAKELRRQLGRKDCNPAWTMFHKLRDVTGKRDSQYELDGTIGLDEGFFATEIPEEEKDKPLKQGRGGQRKTPVMAMEKNIRGSF